VSHDNAPKPLITFGKFQNVDMRVALVRSAPLAVGTNSPSRLLTLDVGPLGVRRSVAQFALLDEADLIGKHVVACVNLAPRQIGDYVSEALTLGVPHPDNPDGQAQALPLLVSDHATPGDTIF
jgi:tRNA-binding protein